MQRDTPSYHGYRFPPAIISQAVWLDHRCGVSVRDVEDLLAQRGITVSYDAIRLWCLTFGSAYARALLVLWLGSRDVVASLRGRPSGAAPGAAGDEIEHFLLDPPDGAPADANRLRKLRGVHQHVDGGTG